MAIQYNSIKSSNEVKYKDGDIIFDDTTTFGGTSDAWASTTIAIPATASKYMNKNIIIRATISGACFTRMRNTSGSSTIKYKIAKIYDSVETELLGETTLASCSSYSSSETSTDADYDHGAVLTSISYTPTANERSNGFTIKVYLYRSINNSGGGGTGGIGGGSYSYARSNTITLYALNIIYSD